MSDQDKPDTKSKNALDLSAIIDQNPNTDEPEMYDDGQIDDIESLDVSEAPNEAKPESPEQADSPEERSGEAIAEQPEGTGADIIDIANRKNPDLKLVSNPELTNDVREDAQRLREMCANCPTIVGRDAELVKFDISNNRLTPRDSDAAATLKMLGDQADIGVSTPPSMLVTPVRYNADRQSLEKNPTKKVRPLPTREQLRNSEIRKVDLPDPLMNKIHRSSGQPTTEGGERPRDPRTEQNTQQSRTPPEMTAGALVLASMGRSIGAAFSAIGRFFKRLWSGLSGAAASTADHIRSKFASSNADSQCPSQYLGSSSAPQDGHQAPTTGREAGASVLDQVNSRRDKLVAEAHGVTNGYHTDVQNQAKEIGEALGVHKVGASIIRSSDDYEKMYNGLSPDNKSRVTDAQKRLSRRSEHLRDQVESVVQHRDMALLPLEDRLQILDQMGSNLSKPYQLTKMEAAALQHGADPYSGNESSMKTIQEATQRANGSLKEAREGIENQQAILQVRTAHGDHHANAQRASSPGAR